LTELQKTISTGEGFATEIQKQINTFQNNFVKTDDTAKTEGAVLDVKKATLGAEQVFNNLKNARKEAAKACST
jgi:hypothetical protein